MGFGIGGLIAVLGSSVLACSGDKSSDDGCRTGACTAPAANPVGAGGSAAAGSSAAGSGNFGNTDAGVPMIVPQADASAGPGETTEPDDPMCGGLQVEPEIQMEVIPGNVLLVFDKSGSMCETWGTSAGQKWQDAYQAVSAALDPLKANVTVGAVFFPDTPTGPGDVGSAGRNCSVPPFNSAPQIEFTDGTSFLAAWDSYWMAATSDGALCSQNAANPVNGATPLLGGIQVADGALTAAALQNTTNVVIITDGQPNCSGGDSRADEPLENLTPTIAAWLVAGYKTYVVGLPGVDEAIPLLNGLAMAGGTAQYIPADDPAALQTNLAMIIGMSVTSSFTTCSIGLPEPPPNPDDVHLVVIEGGVEQDVAADLGASGGWTLATDGSEIVLEGQFCELAKQGQYEKISVVFGCVELPPLDPPPVPE
jgi:hypothetical protein